MAMGHVDHFFEKLFQREALTRLWISRDNLLQVGGEILIAIDQWTVAISALRKRLVGDGSSLGRYQNPALN